MAFRWVILVSVAAILIAEGYLLFERYFYGPLNIIDWSGRVMTLDEKEKLFAELREKLNERGLVEAPTSYELAKLLRSRLDPLAVCGMSRFRDQSGAWESWALFSIEYPGSHIVTKQSIGRPLWRGIPFAGGDNHKIVYRTREGDRAITPHDTFICEPLPTRCPPGQCPPYDWMSGVRMIDPDY